MERLDVRSVGKEKEDVELAVIVVVEDGHAARHGFRRVALRRLATIQLEVNGPESEPDRAVVPGRGGISRFRVRLVCGRRGARRHGLSQEHRQPGCSQ